MIWIKIGIIVVGSLYAVLLPYLIWRAVDHLKLDTKTYTLSFLSNKTLYSKKIVKGYTRLLLIMAGLHYMFFWLLTRYYLLGEEEEYLEYINLSFFLLSLLGLVRHNMLPYSFKTLRASIQRFGHNILAGFVFLTLPGLIITFLILIVPDYPFLGIGGFIIIGIVILTTLWSIIKGGITGTTELIFINGISIWSIFVAIVTVLS